MQQISTAQINSLGFNRRCNRTIDRNGSYSSFGMTDVVDG
jgi:hypothetical protein